MCQAERPLIQIDVACLQFVLFLAIDINQNKESFYGELDYHLISSSFSPTAMSIGLLCGVIFIVQNLVYKSYRLFIMFLYEGAKLSLDIESKT